MSAYTLVGGQDDTEQQHFKKENFIFAAALEESESSIMPPAQYDPPPHFCFEGDYLLLDTMMKLALSLLDEACFSDA
jgi:hypothetical protein